MVQALQHANLGLPVGPSERFRLAKRFLYRAGWPLLRHQIAFNQAVIHLNGELQERITRLQESHRELVERITRLQESNREQAERTARLQERIEKDLRDDLYDFADRSASQAHAEINEQMAAARSTHADLILELRTLQAELNSMVATLTGDLLANRKRTRIEGGGA